MKYIKSSLIILLVIITLWSLAFAYTYKGSYYLESKSYGGQDYIVVLQNGEARGICKK